jgi:hypothetical protein
LWCAALTLSTPWRGVSGNFMVIRHTRLLSYCFKGINMNKK